MIHMMELTLTMSYDSEKEAETVFNAASPDDDSYVTTELKGKEVVFVIKADNAGSMRSAMDDVLVCVKTAEEASGLVSVPAPDLDGDSLLE